MSTLGSIKSKLSSVDSLAIPKRQKVFDKTFLPAGDALPVWSTVPLDGKLPVPPSPRGSYTLYTNKVGEPKYTSRQKYDFDLTNPNGREAPGPYDSLTDPSLKGYFNSPRTKQLLVDNGLITNRGEIKCSIKEFNQYREFVRYRSVTELALQKKKEKRVKQESVDRLFVEWPNIHKKRPSKGKIRLTQSEPPHKDYRQEGLEMYRENLALALRKREDLTRRREEEKFSRRDSRSRRSATQDKRKDEYNHLPFPGPERTTRSPDKTPRSRIGSPDKESMMFSPRGTTLLDDMRRREAELNKRLDEQRRQRIEDHKKKIEENWRGRQYRQEQLLQHEAEIEAKVKDERQQHILDREKVLLQQRKKQEDRLKRIKQEMGKSSKYGGGGGGRGSNSKGTTPSSKGETPVSKEAPTPDKHKDNEEEQEQE